MVFEYMDMNLTQFMKERFKLTRKRLPEEDILTIMK